MDEVNLALQIRRQRFISKQSRLALDQDYKNNPVMTDYNSKIDLRPRSMISKDELSIGKPPVSTVLQPSNRQSVTARALAYITPDQLNKVKLKKVRGDEINDRSEVSTSRRNSDRTSCSTLVNDTSNDVFSYLAKGSSESSFHSPIPPPPPMPPAEYFQNTAYRKMSNDEVHHLVKPKVSELQRSQPIMDEIEFEKAKKEQEDAFNKIYLDRMQQLEERLKRSEEMNQHFSEFESARLRQNVERITTPMENQVGQLYDEPDSDVDLDVKFNERRLKKGNLREWIDELVQDKFERASKLDFPATKTKSSQGKPKGIDKSKSRHSSRGRSVKRSGSQESFRSYKSNASKVSLQSIRSTAKSMKSVLFKRTEEEDLRSEISDDDVANINAGDTSFVDYTYDKFTIHGPFVDKELNVFHSICTEYSLAAKFTFAKRNKFARTNSAHERVYALIGSDKRTSWTNRSDWTRAVSNLQVLDFIFRSLIRSKSRVIKRPVMEIEHFTEGSVLDSRRFKCVIRSIFKKRDHLMDVLGIEMIKFEDIR